MPKLIIDGRNIEFSQGIKVIAAAEQAGIMIPRFCYHPALGSVGACRMCAVKFLEGPVRGLQMSCMVEARDGMVISSTDDEAVDFRRFIIELMMLNHPHDCPVCDEGGHCLLQDETISGGHAMRRYMGNKRTYRDQYLGELVQHEMNRCIQCYRCKRFYQDFCGYLDFGVMGIASRTYFGRYSDGPLENPFSGNLIDICPTGVLTDKPARFKGRRWDFQRAPSLCIHCSLGCHTVVSARYRELMRVEARYAENINGHFICDRGRFGFAFANHPDRPRQARIHGNAATYKDALLAATDKLKTISQSAGPDGIACMASSRSSVETQMSLKFMANALGWRSPCFFMDRLQQDKVAAAVNRLNPDLTISLREVEHADAILVLGTDPIQEAPMLALAMRQAHRAGAKVAVLDPRPVSLPFEFNHWPLTATDLDSTLRELLRSFLPDTTDGFSDKNVPPEAYADSRNTSEMQQALTTMLQNSQRPVIVCGTDIASSSVIAAAADLTLHLQAESKRTGLFYVLPGANAFGATIASAGCDSFSELLGAIENGNIKALLLVEIDPLYQYPDPERMKNALGKLDLLVMMDYLPNRTIGFVEQTPTTMDASAPMHIIIPTMTHFETQASFINQEGRLQRAAPVHSNGMPLTQLSGGKHPPRKFRNDIPGAGAKAAWQVLSELEAAISSSQPAVSSFHDLWSRIGLELNMDVPIENSAEIPNNLRIFPKNTNAQPVTGVAVCFPGITDNNQCDPLRADSFYGIEELSGYSPILSRVESALLKKP
ncbi:MAG: NADH-quinone oxidoreductase subunit NuoG [Deltaproteobacteria bacterium]|nr:NADH-quinone oxidoreductase subunit NuoG [Deltaproteobacteria bacterium]